MAYGTWTAQVYSGGSQPPAVPVPVTEWPTYLPSKQRMGVRFSPGTPGGFSLTGKRIACTDSDGGSNPLVSTVSSSFSGRTAASKTAYWGSIPHDGAIPP